MIQAPLPSRHEQWMDRQLSIHVHPAPMIRLRSAAPREKQQQADRLPVKRNDHHSAAEDSDVESLVAAATVRISNSAQRQLSLRSMGSNGFAAALAGRRPRATMKSRRIRREKKRGSTIGHQ
jgi:hypothetical protein